MRKPMTLALIILVSTLALLQPVAAADTAPAPSATSAHQEFKCRFAKGAWDRSDWTMVKSPRWDYMGEWIQEADHIRNRTPPGATDEEMLGSKAKETYTSMVLKETVSGPVEIAATISFDYRMAPLIVLAGPLTDGKNGTPEYGRHTEIVVYDRGINIWHHDVRDNKPSWFKLAWADFKLKAGKKYELKVSVSGQQIQATIDNHTIGCTDTALPEKLYVGITGIEGINRFYDFSVRRN